MPHIPGHNRPFTSFLTQGMQNTNQNLNTMSMPNNQINFPKYPNPSELPMQPGFQGVGNFYNKPMPKGPSEIPMQQDFMDMGGPKPTDKIQNPSNIPMQQDFIGTGNIKPIEEPSLGNQIDFPNYLQEQPEDPIDYGSLADMYANKPYMQDTYGEGWEWQFDEATGEWSQQFTDPGNFSMDFTSGLVLGDLPHSQNIYHNTYGQTSVWDTGLGGLTENLGQNLEEYEYQQMLEQYLATDPLQLNLGGLNLGGAFNTGLGNLTDNLGLQLARLQTETAPEFTGGGGQGGQQARQLYYPGTSGGFAGVGSGLNPNMLQNLLNRG